MTGLKKKQKVYRLMFVSLVQKRNNIKLVLERKYDTKKYPMTCITQQLKQLSCRLMSIYTFFEVISQRYKSVNKNKKSYISYFIAVPE